MIKLFSVSKKRKKFMYSFVTFLVQARKVKNIQDRKSPCIKFPIMPNNIPVNIITHLFKEAYL